MDRSGKHVVQMIWIVANLVSNETDVGPDNEDIDGIMDQVLPFCRELFELAAEDLGFEEKRAMARLFACIASEGSAATEGIASSRVLLTMLCRFLPATVDSAVYVISGLVSLMKAELMAGGERIITELVKALVDVEQLEEDLGAEEDYFCQRALERFKKYVGSVQEVDDSFGTFSATLDSACSGKNSLL
jgi:hypothetical protein